MAAPFGLTVAFAFSRSTSEAPSYRFAGLRDFRAIFGDHVFWRSLGDTLGLTAVSVVLVVALGTILAHVLLAEFRFRFLVRMLVLLPWTTPVALSAISWRWLLGAPGSPAERLLRDASLLHGGSPLDRTSLAVASVVTVHVWRLTPLAAVIVMAGLAAVPRGVWEAARLDGAGFWRRAFGVTIPLTLPVDRGGGGVHGGDDVRDMAVVRVLTGGGPGDATQVLPALAYARGVERGAIRRRRGDRAVPVPVVARGGAAAVRAARRAVGGGEGDGEVVGP